MRQEEKGMLYQAHRGVQKEYPENTMASIRAAKEQGYDIIEIDPAVTKDGVLVLMHDDTINRTARDKDGLAPVKTLDVRDITFDEANAYEYGGWFDEKYRGEKLPTLKEVVGYAKENGMRVKVDNRYMRFSKEDLERFFAIFSYGADNITFNCPSLDFAKEIKRRFPACTIGFDGITEENELKEIMSALGNDVEIWIPMNKPQTAWWKKEFLNKENARLVAKYAKLCVWLIDNERELSEALAVCSPYAIETTGGVKPPKKA